MTPTPLEISEHIQNISQRTSYESRTSTFGPLWYGPRRATRPGRRATAAASLIRIAALRRSIIRRPRRGHLWSPPPSPARRLSPPTLAARAASAVGVRVLGRALFHGLLRPDIGHRQSEADMQAAVEVEGPGKPHGCS